MAARPSWEGHLRLSLVTCPVALWPATAQAETVRFNMINPKTNNRIRMQTIDAGIGEEVSRSDLVKGFEVAKGECVLFAKEELDAVKLESTRIIHIEKFVPRASIDRLYGDTPYHLVPAGKTGIEAYAVIRAAMAKQNMVAIGRLVMSTRERICAIEIEEGGLVLTTLRTAEEVRALDEVVLPDLPKPDPKMLQIAEKIVEQQSGDFDPSEFRDRYEDALRALIEDKRKGKPVRPHKPANDDEVVDLMAALKRACKTAVGGASASSLPRPSRARAAAGRGRRDMAELGHELEKAMRNVVVARDRLQAAAPDAPDYQAARIDYLEATVHHLAVLAIAQSRQYEDLSEEVSELRARVNAQRAMVH